MAQQFPSGWQESKDVLVCIPSAILPYMQSACELLRRSPRWSSESKQDAIEALIYTQRQLSMARCLDELIESQNRIYRLLEARLSGTQYSWESDGEGNITISPAIPITPAPNISAAMMLHWELLDKRLDNALNGTSYGGYPTNGGVRPLLEQILAKIGEGSASPEDIEEILQLLGQIAVLLG